jgi:ABC-type transporter Mla subunit MlaD
VRVATDASVQAVGQIEQTIGEVNAIASSIAAAVEEQSAATAEISRNVTQTATAANEMTARITEVSAEAEQTGRHAAEVHETINAMHKAVDELRHSVIRVVRTSTTEVDRRQVARAAVDLPCTLNITGQGSQTARIQDISASGASIYSTAPLSAGTHGVLSSSGLTAALPFTVKAAEGDVIHVVFALDAAAATQLDSVLRHVAHARAA